MCAAPCFSKEIHSRIVDQIWNVQVGTDFSRSNGSPKFLMRRQVSAVSEYFANDSRVIVITSDSLF